MFRKAARRRQLCDSNFLGEDLLRRFGGLEEMRIMIDVNVRFDMVTLHGNIAKVPTVSKNMETAEITIGSLRTFREIIKTKTAQRLAQCIRRVIDHPGPLQRTQIFSGKLRQYLAARLARKNLAVLSTFDDG